MKRLILLSALLITPQANADLLTGDYVSPETYAVNEADLQDYRHIPPAPKLDIDHLDDMRFDAPNIVEKDFQIVNDESVAKQEENYTQVENKSKKTKKDKVSKADKKLEKAQREELQPYQKKLSYKIAKWWVDQRYKREEPHHGNLHEIKVNKRIENENKEK